MIEWITFFPTFSVKSCISYVACAMRKPADIPIYNCDVFYYVCVKIMLFFLMVFTGIYGSSGIVILLLRWIQEQISIYIYNRIKSPLQPILQSSLENLAHVLISQFKCYLLYSSTLFFYCYLLCVAQQFL